MSYQRKQKSVQDQIRSGRISVRQVETKNQKPKKKTSFREYTEAILVALLAAMFLRAFVVQAFRIPTGSMKDTLLVGDFLLVNKFIYGVRTPDRIPIFDAHIPFNNPPLRLPAFKQPQNGDVVVFKYPENPRLDYIKRCIAVGGQTVEVRNGEVFVDGKPEGKHTPLWRRYDSDDGQEFEYTRIDAPNGKSYTIRHLVGGYSKTENFGPVTVPAGNYFMMGDNRDNSADSRSWGLLPEESVVGEALIIYFSWHQGEDLLNLIRWTRIANWIR